MMRIFRCVLTVATVLVPQTPIARAAEQTDLLLVLAMDVSRSMDRAKFLLQRHAAAISSPQVLDAIKSGPHQKIALCFIDWSGPFEQKLVIDWTIIDGPAAASHFGDLVAQAPRSFYNSTSIGAAIKFATARFARAPFEAERHTGKRDIAAYGLITDLDNNVYGLDNNPDQRQIWRTNAKTGETTYIDLPLGVGGARRGHIDSQNRLWFSQFHANRYAMYDPKTGKITQWEVPVDYAGAYDVQFDDAGYAWGADMSTDLVQRLNVETGEWSSYLLPTSINTRHIDVQKSSNPNVLSSMWTEDQQTGKIVHIEPLTP